MHGKRHKYVDLIAPDRLVLCAPSGLPKEAQQDARYP